VRQLLEASGSKADVEVDGGIDLGNIARVVAAGASLIVVGAAIFEQPDPEDATRVLRARAVDAATGRGPR
jgi:ribulose-phosphate 3-epimerase